MKLARKTIAILLVLVMSISLTCMAASAARTYDSETEKLLAGVKTEAADMILDCMKKHETFISFPYAIKYDVGMEKAMAIVASSAERAAATLIVKTRLDTEIATLRYLAAVHDPKDPTGGDYLDRQCCSFKPVYTDFDFSRLIEDGIVIARVNISLAYRSTGEEEAIVDEVVSALVGEDGELCRGEKSQYEQVKAIYDWMYENIGFDSEAIAFYDTTPEASSAYAALVKGKTTSEGFAIVFYRLCLASGINCRVVSAETDNLPHVWNVVKVDGNWYYIDSSRGEGNGKYLFPYPKYATEDYWETALFLKGSHYWSNVPVFTVGDQYANPITHPGFADSYPVSEGSYYPEGEEHDCAAEKDLIYYPEKTDSNGNVTGEAYYECRECGKLYSDEGGTQELEKAPSGQSSFNIGALFGGFFQKIINFFRSLFPFC